MYYPSDITPDMFDPYEEHHTHYHTNIMWCRGRTQIFPDSRRRIHMGRGTYELPPRRQTIDHQITQVYEQRNRHYPHYQTENNIFDDDDGVCLFCGQPAKYNCFQCKGFYCSTGCQARDWPTHQSFCIPMPKLVHIKNGAENGQQALKSTEPSETPPRTGESPRLPHGNVFEEPRRTRPRNPLFPQPSKPVASSTFPVAPSTSELPKPPFKDLPQTAEKSKMTLPKKSPKPSPKPSPKMSPKMPSPKSTPLNLLQKTSPQVANQSPRSVLNPESWKVSQPKTAEPKQQASFEKPEPQQKQDGSRKEDRQSPALSTKKETEKKETEKEENHDDSLEFEFEKLFITKEAVEVMIMSDLGNSTYWVQKPSEVEDLTMVMEQLQEEVKNWPDVEPLLGQMYVLPYMELWHRVKVVKMNPLMIEFTDYGGEEEPESKAFKTMSDEFKELPAFAQKIKFTSDENLKPEDIVKIKLVKKENGLLTVERAAKVNDGVSEVIDYAREKPVTDLGMVFKYLKINEEGFLQIHTPLRNGVFSVTLIPESIAEQYQERNDLLQKVCNQNLPNNLGYKPAVGEMVAAMKGDAWVRGKVIKCEDKIQVIACDEGQILFVDKVLPLTESFGQIPALGVTCEFLEIDKTVLAEDLLQFVVNDSNTVDNKPCVDIHCVTSDGRKKKCVVKPWIPQPDQTAITHATIKPNSKVIVTAYTDHHEMYVRPLDPTEVEKFSALAQEISIYGSYAQPMTVMPKVERMVVAQYKEDNNFYRAIVKDIKNDKIQIKYLDFGNLETTSLKRLYEIPLEYKSIDSAVCPVILKDVPWDVAMKKEVEEYLDMLVAEERQLVVKFDKIENGVELMINNKESVNGFINEIVAPPCKQPEEVKHCFMVGQLPKTVFGKVGDVIELTVLERLFDGFGYFMCVLEGEKLEYIDGTMKEELNKYARSVKDHYIPQLNELCIAMYNDNYYRAYCYQPSASPTSANLMFVDYGNVADVPHKDIRPMTQDFMEPSPLGSICMVQNLISEDMDPIPEPLLTRVRELMGNHEQVKAKIVDYIEEELTHVVEVEDVARTLKEEKLL